ncbi:TetR/AcrR family transcriptional regulator [Tardiphaga sp.]|uniref:TetR/AcrR family transcriptional regulator n=1 Tax=Tardiphaga sp. TaxID=1926292 RepID=UPI00352A3521
MARTAVARPRTASEKTVKSRGGRPTKSAAIERDLRLLDCATELFLERGFDATSIDAVAEAARVSKPTVYGQYVDKRGLFEAVLKREIGRWIAPLAAAAEITRTGKNVASFEKQLVELGRQLIATSASKGANAVVRILAAQSASFPELGELAFREGWSRLTGRVEHLFDEMAGKGLCKVDSAAAAEAYLSIVVSSAMRSIIYRRPIDVEADEKRMRAAVRILFGGLVAR